MLNFFKKKEADTLDTPKNLPELAKDIFEPQSPESLAQNKDSVNKGTVNKDTPTNALEEHKIPNVPVSSNVPRLDLNLIRSSNIILQNSDIDPRGDASIQRLPSLPAAPMSIAVPRNDVQEIPIQRNVIHEQRNVYINNKNKMLFDDLESAIISNRTDMARDIVANILPLLYEYHDVDSMNNSDRLRELKDLEKFWEMLQKRNYGIRTVLDSVENDILRKSNGLLNGTGASGLSNNNDLTIRDGLLRSSVDLSKKNSYDFFQKNTLNNTLNTQNTASSNTAFTNFSPVLVPIIKNSVSNNSVSNNSVSNNSVSNNSVSNNPVSNNPVSNNSSNDSNSSNIAVASANVVYVQPNERFYFKDGKIASSLRELYYMIIDISDDTFYHHVSLERNDFSNWVRDVLKEYSLAKEISAVYTRKELLDVIKKGIL